MEADIMKEYSYKILEVSSENITSWLDVCAAAFGAKGTPREHFEDHWTRDPWTVEFDAKTSNEILVLSPIFVAIKNVSGVDRIVASVRVFRRRAWLKGKVMYFGGIGEVGTIPEERGKGHAQKLMQMAVDWMKDTGIIDFGMLHTGNAAPFYSKLGWRAIPRRLVNVRVQDLLLLSKRLPHEIRMKTDKISYASDSSLTDDEIAQLGELYEDFCSHLNLCGSVSRTTGNTNSIKADTKGILYWKKWILQIPTVPRTKDHPDRYITRVFSSEKLVAYMIWSKIGGEPQIVREFACNLPTKENVAGYFAEILQNQQFDPKSKLQLPWPLVTVMISSLENLAIDTEEDSGSMYFPVSEQFHLADVNIDNHLFWNLDFF